MPKSGYINALDFASPKHLTDYLIYLDKNRTAYNSYFMWKKHVCFLSHEKIRSPICDICIKLNLDEHLGFQQNIIPNVSTFWDSSSNCKNVNKTDWIESN